MKVIASILFLIVFSGEVLQAEKIRSVFIRWKKVRGSLEYVVQYRKGKTGKIIERKVKTNGMRIKLSSGNYSVRVAGLNKFGKPGPWSSWKKMKITAKTKEITPEKEIIEPDKKEAEQKKSKPTKKSAPFFINSWTFFFPGAPQFMRGDEIRGFAYWGIYAGLGGALNSERLQGNTLALDPFNDPVFLTTILMFRNQPLIVGFLFNHMRNSAEEQYNRHQANQRALGGAALMLYAIHILDATLLGPKSKHSISFLHSLSYPQQLSTTQRDISRWELSFQLRL